MRDDQLPTPAQMLAKAGGELDKAFAALQAAYMAFSDAADWLRSDWPPGCELTNQQAVVRDRMHETISTGKRLLNEIKNVPGGGIGDTLAYLHGVPGAGRYFAQRPDVPDAPPTTGWPDDA